jgi:hypothetical protein
MDRPRPALGWRGTLPRLRWSFLCDGEARGLEHPSGLQVIKALPYAPLRLARLPVHLPRR